MKECSWLSVTRQLTLISGNRHYCVIRIRVILLATGNQTFRVDARSNSSTAALYSGIVGNARKHVHTTWKIARKSASRAAAAGMKDFINTIDTSGYGMPYKADPSTDARVNSGRMRADVSKRIVTDTDKQFSVRVGWVDGAKKYYNWQDNGTSPGAPPQHGPGGGNGKGIRAMNAKKHAAAVIRQEFRHQMKMRG